MYLHARTYHNLVSSTYMAHATYFKGRARQLLRVPWRAVYGSSILPGDHLDSAIAAGALELLDKARSVIIWCLPSIYKVG